MYVLTKQVGQAGQRSQWRIWLWIVDLDARGRVCEPLCCLSGVYKWVWCGELMDWD